MSDFSWNSKTEKAALLLAQGYTIAEAASEVGINERTIYRWKNDIDFQVEVDRLSLMVDIAGRAERLRIAMRVVRQSVKNNIILTEKDLLDWLKFAQSETDGIKLDLTALSKVTSPMADS